jgi:hypothetical protein
VHVHERGARFERRVRGFDLLADGDWHRRLFSLRGTEAGDGDGDDAGQWCAPASCRFY